MEEKEESRRELAIRIEGREEGQKEAKKRRRIEERAFGI
jgi:hypothetical protein